MTNMKPRIPMSADALRRRVRRITAACVGAATLAAAALTVNLAWATDDPAASSSSAATGDPTSTSGQPSTGSSSANGRTRAPVAPLPFGDGSDGSPPHVSAPRPLRLRH